MSQHIQVRRPEDHHKGPKVIAEFPLGTPVPPGVLIGKGAIIEIIDRDDD